MRWSSVFINRWHAFIGWTCCCLVTLQSLPFCCCALGACNFVGSSDRPETSANVVTPECCCCQAQERHHEIRQFANCDQHSCDSSSRPISPLGSCPCKNCLLNRVPVATSISGVSIPLTGHDFLTVLEYVLLDRNDRSTTLKMPPWTTPIPSVSCRLAWLCMWTKLLSPF